MKLLDLFSLDEIQRVQDAFSAATGVASLITSPEGIPITQPSGFCRVCNDFVRVSPVGIQNCLRSDKCIGDCTVGETYFQECLSAGFLDGAVRVMAGEAHLANWLVGQVIADGVDTTRFEHYAFTIGADPMAYRKALNEVKRMPVRQFESILEFLHLVVHMMSNEGMQKKQLSDTLADREMHVAELGTVKRQLELLVIDQTCQLEASHAALEKSLAEMQEMNAVLEEANRKLYLENQQRLRANEQIEALNEELRAKNGLLENTVDDRTRDLHRLVSELENEMEERKLQDARNLYVMYHDSLTGLSNLRFFENALKELDVPSNLPIAIVLGDVNGLKLINDAFGHGKGDELLLFAASSIQRHTPAGGIVARWGGDEFVMLLPQTTMIGAEHVVARIQKEFQALQFNGVRGSISFGWAVKTSWHDMLPHVLKNAEDIMYRHKIIENEGMRGNAIQAIISALHEKNPREEKHSMRVSELCQKIGRHLGMSPIEISRLKVIGLLHDIGKIAIDESILNNPGRLSASQYEEIQRHPEIGYRILNTSYELRELAECVMSHHERWDGQGYPKRLSGTSIPFVSRIIAVVDSFDAMTSERPYRPCLSVEQALLEIGLNAGKQFDPHIADSFVRMMGSLVSNT